MTPPAPQWRWHYYLIAPIWPLLYLILFFFYAIPQSGRREGSMTDDSHQRRRTMGRPRKRTPAEIIQAHSDSRTVSEMAHRLKVTQPTIYKWCRENNLAPPRQIGRPDLAVFTDEQLRQAHEKSKTVAHIAKALGCSSITVRKHLARLQLPINGRTTAIDRIATRQCFDLYMGMVTIRDLATRFNVSASAVRAAIDREIKRRWSSPKPPKLPVPITPTEVKVYNAMARTPAITATELTELFGIPGDEASRYMARAARTNGAKP